ncbi:hypothetical protein RHSIM_Rhsim12G0204100 [Rhododendron simsii]|uniref:Uncharacterized protein n=1 Tax=Rhododendron simsii TaxID=118357 RepID=A0A834G7G7_RHOSS|nr:hypothetical protein RHSIM_Rhsim12G0204100 [Rhododendron simsii]
MRPSIIDFVANCLLIELSSAMESKSHKTLFVTLIIIAMVLSPMLTSCEAARFTHRELLQETETCPGCSLLQTEDPICPACVCCSPPPPGECCPCCATPP